MAQSTSGAGAPSSTSAPVHGASEVEARTMAWVLVEDEELPGVIPDMTDAQPGTPQQIRADAQSRRVVEVTDYAGTRGLLAACPLAPDHSRPPLEGYTNRPMAADVREDLLPDGSLRPALPSLEARQQGTLRSEREAATEGRPAGEGHMNPRSRNTHTRSLDGMLRAAIGRQVGPI